MEDEKKENVIKLHIYKDDEFIEVEALLKHDTFSMVDDGGKFLELEFFRLKNPNILHANLSVYTDKFRKNEREQEEKEKKEARKSYRRKKFIAFSEKYLPGFMLAIYGYWALFGIYLVVKLIKSL